MAKKYIFKGEFVWRHNGEPAPVGDNYVPELHNTYASAMEEVKDKQKYYARTSEPYTPTVWLRSWKIEEIDA